jgi:hypothetical protein
MSIRKMTGRCLCGKVQFVVKGRLGEAVNCHCKTCRKAHSAAFRSRVGVMKSDFNWTDGEHLLRWFASSPSTRRGFCSNCGTRLISEFVDDQESLGVPLALFDQDPQVRPVAHIHVSSKASWYEICDELPQFDKDFPD